MKVLIHYGSSPVALIDEIIDVPSAIEDASNGTATGVSKFVKNRVQ